ncbi:DUF229 domain-containing protein [bacterium]|nr:DUF229 domain-containing protein [bacterium]
MSILHSAHRAFRIIWSFSWMKLFLTLAYIYHTCEVYAANESLRSVFKHPVSFTVEMVSILYGWITFIAIYSAIDMTVSRWRWGRLIVNILFLNFFGWTSAYYFGISFSPDFALIAETFRDGFSFLTFEIAAKWLDPIPLIVSGIMSVVFLVFELWKRAISKVSYTLNFKSQYLVVIGITVFSLASRLDPVNEVSRFAKLAVNYYTESTTKGIHVPPGEYPYLKNNFAYTDMPRPGEKPNVFIIVIESFNERFVGEKSPDGKEITPFINQLRDRGLYVEHYYSPTVLSMIGYGSMYVSVLPATRGIMLRSDKRLYGYPEMFKRNGYYTMAVLQETPEFIHDEGPKIGFEDIQSIYDIAQPEDHEFRRSPSCYEDRVVYKYALKRLDEIERHQKSTGDRRPILANIVTLYNHVGFDAPPERRHIVPEPKNIKEQYMNTAYLSDLHLKQFLAELAKRPHLKNSIIIITGDHGYPTGEHGIGSTESGVFEESFRVPFILIWDGVVQPHRIKATDAVYSHLDMAPTLVDLTGIKVTANAMTGVSMFAPRPATRNVVLVQPYNGMYLMSIRYPWKYRQHVRTGKEYLYNLADDPHEERNLMLNVLKKPPVDLDVLRKDVEYAHFNQYLFENDQIWPGL